MTTIEVKPGTRIGIEDILTGVSHLDAEELDQFVNKVLALRAKRVASNLSKEETTILKKINRGLPVAAMQRLTALEEKQDKGTLTEQEHRELMEIVAALEQLNVERVQYIGELAQIRGVAARELMEQLGIYPRSYG